MAVEPVSSVEEFRRVSPFRRAWVLFWAYVRITSLVIGGGYAIIAAAQDEFVRRRKWLTEDDVLEMITITQTVPGILATNSAIYVGWRIGGCAGAFAAMVGSILPSLVIIVLIAAGISSIQSTIDTPAVQGAFKGIIGCIVGMVIVTALKMRRKAVVNLFGWIVALGCFLGLTVFKVGPAWLIVCAIAAGLAKVTADRIIARCRAKREVER